MLLGTRKGCFVLESEDRRDWDVGGHKLVESPVDLDRMYQQNHWGTHRSDDTGHSWVEITDGVPTAPPPHSAAALPGPAARLEVEASTVDEAIEHLNQRWPGVRDRLCEPGPTRRPHINVYVDRERAQLETPLDARSRIDVIAAISGG